MFIPGPQAKVDLKQFMSPVGAQRHCWVRRVSKQCVAMYDRENGGNFVACARLVSKMKRDMTSAGASTSLRRHWPARTTS